MEGRCYVMLATRVQSVAIVAHWAELECPGSPVGHCITPPSANLPRLTRPLPSCRGYIAATSGAAGRGGNYLNYYTVASMWWQSSIFCDMILSIVRCPFFPSS